MNKFLETYAALFGPCSFGNVRELQDGSLGIDICSARCGVVDTVVMWTAEDLDAATSQRSGETAVTPPPTPDTD